jgi:hypothetical protein
MTTTHPKMEALLQSQAEERSRLEIEIAVERALPAALQPYVYFIFRHGKLHGGYTAIKLKKEPKGYHGSAFTLREALQLRGAFAADQLVGITVGKDSFTHVQPAWDEPKGKPYWDAEGTDWAGAKDSRFPWLLKTDIHGEVGLHFYAKIGDLNLMVEIELGGIAYKMVRHQTRSFAHGEVTLYDKTSPVALPGTRTITWSGGGDRKNPKEVSMFPSDPVALVDALEPVGASEEVTE